MTDQYNAALRAKAEGEQLRDVFESLKAEILADIGNTNPEETSKREALYHQFHGLEAVRTRLAAKASGAAVEENKIRLAEAGFSR